MEISKSSNHLRSTALVLTVLMANLKMDLEMHVDVLIQLPTTMILEPLTTMAIVFTSVAPMPQLVIMTNQPIRMMRHVGTQSLAMIVMAFA